jgi:hypothetical protein
MFQLTFLCTGDWGPGDVDVEWVPSTRTIVPEVEALIERTWAQALARPGAHLFDGPMCRLERWEATPNGRRLRLALSRTSYKPFLGTNMSHPELTDRFGAGVMANPVGVSPALETSDGFLLLGRRNTLVAYYPGRIHPFAGALEPRDGGDAFVAVRRELREELSIGEPEVLEVRCTGLVDEAALRQTEMIFRVRCALDRVQIEARLDPTEHHEICAVRATEDGIVEGVADAMLTPVAGASLLLWARGAFGKAWFAARVSELQHDSRRSRE